MRELGENELHRVTGAGLNLVTGAIGAGLGGATAGAVYAINSSGAGDFTWGGFTFAVATSAASGFLLGTGTTLVAAGITGVLPGAQVLGVSVGGAGAALGIAANVNNPTEKKDGGS